MSFHDHNERESHAYAMCYTDEATWDRLETRDNRLEYLADVAMPWYVNFYAGWFAHLNQHPGSIVVCPYEDVVERGAAEVLHEKLNHLRIPHSLEAIGKAVEKSQGMKTRKNKGLPGRGREIPDAVRAKIAKLFGYYPHIDFSQVGIEHMHIGS